jgi:predicted DNA-binding protein
MLQRGWAIKHERNYRDNMNIRLPWGIKEELKRIADQRNMTLSDLVRLSIEKFLAEVETEDKLRG